MPTITVHQEDLYRLAGLDAGTPLSQLEEALALVKGELKVAVQSEGAGELRIELADTNRPDLWSVEGIARQLRDHAHGRPRAYACFAGGAAAHEIVVEPALAGLRPFIGGFLAVDNVLDEAGLLAFIEAQEALTRNFGRRRQTVSIGLYNGAGLAFPVHYRAVPRDACPFVPLPPAVDDGTWPHGLAMTPGEILARHPTGQEYGWILADAVRVPMLLDQRGEVLSLPPIVNSAGLGKVTPGAGALFVEATGTDLDQCLLALNILAANLVDRGWSVVPVTAVYPYATPRGDRVTAPHPLAISQQVAIPAVSRLLGTPVTPEEVTAGLAAYGVQAVAVGEEVLATAPSYRQDYLHPVDVIEDFAISRGYGSFAPAGLAEFTVGRLDALTEFEDRVRDLMIGFGFEEAICNILTSAWTIRRAMAVDETPEAGAAPFHGGPAVQVENVMNRNYSHLRDWIVPSLLEVEAHSLGALYPHRIFEVGEVAVYAPDQALGARTESRVGAILAAEGMNFDAAQSVVYALLGSLAIPFSVTPWPHPSFIPGRVAAIRGERGEHLGFLGELAPQVLANWGTRVPIAALELSVNRLQAAHGGPDTAG